MTRILALSFLLATLLAAGCATSPQQVHIQPAIDVHSQLAKQPVIHLTIEDRRGRTEFGTRGGIYGQTNFISPAADLRESIRPAAVSALTELGARVDGVSPFPINLTLALEQLNYKVDEARSLPVTINLDGTLQLIAKRGDKTLSGRYNSGKQHSFIKSPSEEENEKIINELLSELLSRAVNDPKLLSFLEE